MSEPNGKDTQGEKNESLSVPAFEISAVGKNPAVKMSFNPQTPDGAVRLVQATLKEATPLETLRDMTINLTHWMCHPASTAGEAEGEVKPFTRYVLWDDKGNFYSCGSIGVDKSLALFELSRGKAPWNPPFKCKVVVKRLPNKNNWMYLDPDIESLTAVLSARK